MKKFEVKIVIKDAENNEDISVCFKTENYDCERQFEFDGYQATGEEIHDWLLGQVARVLDIEDILKRDKKKGR